MVKDKVFEKVNGWNKIPYRIVKHINELAVDLEEKKD